MIVPLYKATPPYTRNMTGFGYLGVIMWNDKKNLIQCHVCGNWMKSLSHHISRIHHIKTKEYRKEYGLLVTTPLSTPEIHEQKSKMSSNNYYKYLHGVLVNHSQHRGGRKIKTMRAQELNRKGNCPLQIEDRVRKLMVNGCVTKRNIPTGLLKSIYLRYGTWNKYLELNNIAIRKTSLKKSEIIGALLKFVRHKCYFPTREQINQKQCLPLLSYRPVIRVFGGMRRARRLVLSNLSPK